MIELDELERFAEEHGAEPVREVRLGDGMKLELLYPRSMHRVGDQFMFLAREAGAKRLFVASSGELRHRLEGETSDEPGASPLRRCPLNHANAAVIRELFDFARPALLGTADSFGFGDRLGLANPAHLRAVAGSGFRPVLAQQSIRELERTARSAEEVMDVATWAVLQEGFHEGFGADADHLKTFGDIDRTAAAGFTMFTIDPGEHVVNEADVLGFDELDDRADKLPWELLEDSRRDLVARYDGRRFEAGEGLVLEPQRVEVLRAIVKYGAAIAHVATMYRHLCSLLAAERFELEVSVDETEAVTTPFDHLLFATELERLGVRWVSLAPRFVGDFEKGIDFRGDLADFERSWRQHLAIAESFGGYKLSVHSGSDKFSAYRVIASVGRGSVHIKTAGTSFLEALRTIADREPALFREILDFAREVFESERQSYHVSAEPDRVPPSAELDDEDLVRLLDQEDARQVLHVSFGRVLTDAGEDGTPLFKDRLLDSLNRHESIQDRYLEAHFRRHLEPFVAARTSQGGEA
jgi:hypothetical protein